MQQFIGSEDVISNKFCQYSDNSFEKKYESDEERMFYEEKQNINFISEEGKKILQICHFELRHSLAWYLMNQVDNEIEKMKQKIEIQKCLPKIIESIDETITIIRKSQSEYQATVELMGHVLIPLN